MIIVLNMWIGRGMSFKSEIPSRLPAINKISMSTSVKTLWPACTATYFDDRQIGAYSIGFTFLGETQLSKQEKERGW